MTDSTNEFNKRQRSSEGETPKPERKQSKMATCELSDFNELKDSVLSIAKSVKEIKDGQDSMKKMVESKIDKLRKDVLSTIDDKIKALKTDIDIDMARESSRMDTLAKSLETLTTRIDTIQGIVDNVPVDEHGLGNNGQANTQNAHGNPRRPDPLNDNEITVIVKNVPYSDDEDITEKANNIINSIGEDISNNVKIVAAARLRKRFRDKPALIKVSFENSDQKVLVLRNKYKLKEVDEYKRVFIQGAKSRMERLLETNARTILKELPHGNSYRITGSGRILKKNENVPMEANDIQNDSE